MAVSLGGVVELADPLRARSVCRFQTQGPITSEPCISNGVLYLATRGQVSAYALAPMTMDPPRVRPLWQVPISGTPIHALTVMEDRLYVTIASAGRREVAVIEAIDRQPSGARPLHSASKTSWVAADPRTSQAAFFSEDDGWGLQLHVVGQVLATYPVSLRSLAEQPIALLGGAVFGVFGDEHRLYRIDASSGSVEEPLEEDTQLFALTGAGEDEWDRDGVRIDSKGVLFTRAGIHDAFAPHEWASRGSPLIVQGSAVVVGMEDGRIRVYDLAHLPRHDVWMVGGNSGAAITALASFDKYVAAGNKEGTVEVRELRSKAARP